MAQRTPKTPALFIALMLKRANRNRARISTKTLLLLSKCKEQLESSYLQRLKEQLLDCYNIAFFERPKGGFIALKLNDLDTSAYLKASDTLGNLHLRALKSEDFRVLRHELCGLPGNEQESPLLLSCFAGTLYYDSEDFEESDLIMVDRLILRLDTVAFDMTTTWNGVNDKLTITGVAHLDKASGKYIAKPVDVRSVHDKSYSATASIELDLELDSLSQEIEVHGTFKFSGADYSFSGDLARFVPTQK